MRQCKEDRLIVVTVKRYIFTALIGVLICLTVLWARGLFGGIDLNRAYRILCDGFFVTSVLLMGCGLLAAISATGFFDIFGYAAVWFFSLFFTDLRKGRRARDYYEYRESKRGNRKTVRHMVIVGAVFFIAALWFQYQFYSSINS